jgi:signal transduction histidine kinase
MKNLILKVFYCLCCVPLFFACDTRQKSVDIQYIGYCFDQMDAAVDKCRDNVTDSLDNVCYKQYILIDTIKDIDTEIWHEYARARGLFNHMKFDEAKESVNHLLSQMTDSSFQLEQAKLLELRGNICVISGEEQPAAIDYYKSINIYLQLDLQRNAAKCYRGITNVQFRVGNYKLAIENGQRAIAIETANKIHLRTDSVDLINIYNTLGLAYQQIHELDSAMKYFEYSRSMATDLKEEFWIGLVNGNTAKVLFEKGDMEEAERRIRIDINTSRKFNEDVSVAVSLLSMGDLCASRNQKKEASLYYDSAYQLQKVSKSKPVLAMYYRTLAKFNRNQENFRDGDIYFQRYITLRDSLQGATIGNGIEQIQNKARLEKQLTDINLLRMENTYKTKKVRLWQLCIGVVACALVLLFILYRNNRKLNRQLTRLNVDLEEKIKHRTTELIKTNKELDTYLYRASHDVRRPILSIIGLAQIAEFAIDIHEQSDIRKKIIATARDMDKMLHKLKMTYELRASVEKQTFDLYEYVSVLSQDLVKFYPSAKFQIAKSGDTVLTSDIRFINMIFLNIMENACVFRHVDSGINVNIEGDADYISVNIEDHGIGIQEEYLTSIFEAYTRFSERSIGSGIGLYIVSKALSKIGGSINVRSIVYEGSVVKVRMPRNIQVSDTSFVAMG